MVHFKFLNSSNRKYIPCEVKGSLITAIILIHFYDTEQHKGSLPNVAVPIEHCRDWNPNQRPAESLGRRPTSLFAALWTEQSNSGMHKKIPVCYFWCLKSSKFYAKAKLLWTPYCVPPPINNDTQSSPKLFTRLSCLFNLLSLLNYFWKWDV